MKKRITLIATSLGLWFSVGHAQSPCSNDLNGFVESKNTNTTGFVQLRAGFEEHAAQTYNYTGPGKIYGAKVYGNYQGFGMLSGVPLRVTIYNVDIGGRPTTPISSVDHIWWSYPDNYNGYMNVPFPGGVSINGKFALAVSVLSTFPYGSSFDLKYTGNSEGLGQDLASLSGTSTGGNWASAMTSFGKDGDFYIIPNMTHINTPSFTTISNCYATNAQVSFQNNSQFTKDTMFNKIARYNYTGSNFMYTWDFGDGSPISHLENPTHNYTLGGAFTVSLTTKIEGWEGVCSRTTTRVVSIGLTSSANSISNVDCFNSSNGSIVANAQFGYPPYLYNLNGGSWQSNENFTGLPAGNYTLNVIDSKNCTSVATFNITQPTGIAFNTIQTTNASCNQSNGGFSCNASGGISPLLYKLNNGSFVSSGTFSNLASGSYALTVKDANGCTSSTTVIVNSQSGPIVNVTNFTSVSCYNGNDGTISLSATGGVGTLQYSINNGTTFQSSGTFTGLVAGTYICLVKDNATCKSYAQVIISQSPELISSVVTRDAKCYGSNDGEIEIISSGGTGSKSYSLNGVNFQSSPLFSSLTAGTYSIYIKDITSCIKIITAIVNQPSILNTTFTITNASCFNESNGEIAATTNGGVQSYEYSIDGIHFQTLGLFENLPQGEYIFTTKDENNCRILDTIQVGEPNMISAVVNTTNATCSTSNGAIMVIGSGGSGSGFTYSMDGITFGVSGVFSGLTAGTQFVVIKDGSGCKNTVSGVIVSAGGPTIDNSSSQNVSCHGGNDGAITISNVSGGTGTILYSKDGVTFQSSNYFSGLIAGTYIIQVKDANGCISTITKIITEPNAFLITTSVNNVTCFNDQTGSVNISASGGAGFFAYSINGGLTYQSSTLFNNLHSGNYTVTIKDAANCTSSTNFMISQPLQIHAIAGVLNVSCHGANDGQIHVYASGGISPYMYSINGTQFYNLGDFENLTGNTFYQVYVKDANGCIVSNLKYVSEPAILDLNSTMNDVSCTGGNNGFISLNLTGGVSPYTYSWSNGSSSSAIENLIAGNYNVTVTDHNGCSESMNFIINQPLSPIIVNAVLTSASDNISQDGAIDLTVNGGTPPYLYSWSTGSVNQDLDSLNPGDYTITITDAKGCALSTIFKVEKISGLLDLSNENVQLYPNPSVDYIFIDAGKQIIENIRLFSISGQLISDISVNKTKFELKTNEFSNGIYLVNLLIEGKTITNRIVIQK